jgi:hypothetical protein
MDQENPANLLPGTGSLLHTIRQKLARVPLKLWIILALFSIAATLLAFHAAHTDRSASLHLKVQHGFHSGELSVWIDGQQACSDKLTGYVRKKFGLIPESVQGSLSRTVPLSPGNHEIRVHLSGDDGFNQEDTVSGEFVRNTERTLAVATRRGGIALAWQGETSAPVEGSSGLAWLSRYASTLLVTIAGSIISALTGFAVREVPAYIRKRENADELPRDAALEVAPEVAPRVRSASAGE